MASQLNLELVKHRRIWIHLLRIKF